MISMGDVDEMLKSLKSTRVSRGIEDFNEIHFPKNEMLNLLGSCRNDRGFCRISRVARSETSHNAEETGHNAVDFMRCRTRTMHEILESWYLSGFPEGFGRFQRNLSIPDGILKFLKP